jgi:flagellar hook-basal body complex protein FliE
MAVAAIAPINAGITPLAAVAPVQAAPASPFSQFMDTAVNSLNDISTMESQTNQLTSEYINGRVSLEEVMLQTNKLSINMQLAVTVINTGVQTFKEIQQMQV